MVPIEYTIELVVNQPPTSGCFLIPDSGQTTFTQLVILQKIASYNGQTGNAFETRSNEKTNAFEREAERVRTTSQTCSNEKPNAFAQRQKRVL